MDKIFPIGEDHKLSVFNQKIVTQLLCSSLEEWFENALLPNILPNSLIVLIMLATIAVGVSLCPCIQKAKLMEWLDKQGIEYL